LPIKGDPIGLVAENPNYKAVFISEDLPLEVLGVATYFIHSYGGFCLSV
jgi:SOS-response transcriptional repressor LexA